MTNNLKDYTAFFEATVYNENSMAEETEYGAIPASSFAEAATLVEEYYGEDLVKVTIELMEGGILVFDKETYNKARDRFNF